MTRLPATGETGRSSRLTLKLPLILNPNVLPVPEMSGEECPARGGGHYGPTSMANVDFIHAQNDPDAWLGLARTYSRAKRSACSFCSDMASA